VRIVCPGCRKVLENVPADYPPRPFCSPRCKLADLGNWLSERYVVSQPLPPKPLQGDEDEHLH